jgi:Rad3-related DNA helicase
MLIDDRFAESRIKQLLPRWWAINHETDASQFAGLPHTSAHDNGW